ncbi:MAG: NAD(P)/FAD-dependent oxidoreductase [Bacteroidota bacterium]
MTSSSLLDVIIIGGSYAGLSAAMALGRSMRKTLIIDHGQPCNRQTPHAHNFLTQDGQTPAAISTLAREQVERYPTIRFCSDLAISGEKVAEGFEIHTQQGQTFKAKKLIFASGIKDIMPDIKGFAACWGISVIHCPYCHGYEYRGKKTGIMVGGDRAFHLATLVANLTQDLSIICAGPADFSETQMNRLQKNQIKIIESRVTEIEHHNGHLKALVFDNGDKQVFDAVYAGVPFEQHTKIPLDLGCEYTDQGYIQTDDFQKTNVPGIFACGDNASPLRAVAQAIAKGNMAGAIANSELAEEQF